MKRFAALLAVGLVRGAAALTCVKTPAEFVANLETINYQKLDRPNVAFTGKASAPPDNASVAYDLKYLLSVDQRLQRMETTGTFWGTWTDYRLAFDENCAGVNHFHLPDTVVHCVEINQCVGCTWRGCPGSVERRGTGIATPSSGRRVDGVEDDAAIQHERAVKF